MNIRVRPTHTPPLSEATMNRIYGALNPKPGRGLTRTQVWQLGGKIGAASTVGQGLYQLEAQGKAERALNAGPRGHGPVAPSLWWSK